jgi:cytochrome c-type biogenesis protein CcmH/NrfF
LLWLGPALFLVVGLAGLALVLRRRSTLAHDRFEPETDDDDAEASESSAALPCAARTP